MSDLRDLLSAEAERQRPHSSPPYDEIAHRANRRARMRKAAVGCAVVAVVAAAAVSSSVLSGSDDQTRSGPAGPSVSTTPSTSIPTISGPRTLGAPIELRQVLKPPVTCTGTGLRVFLPGAGDGCFELADPEIVVRHVTDLSVVDRPAADGSVQGDQAVRIALDGPDAAKFAALTAARWDGERVALVVDGVVYAAPQIQGPISGGQLELPMDADMIARLLGALTTDNS